MPTDSMDGGSAAPGSGRPVRFAFAPRVLLAALAVDLVLIAVWVAHLGPEGSEGMPRPFRIEVDGSLGELANYVKYIVAGVLVWRMGAGRRVLAAVFAVLLLDDAGKLHERMGDVIGAALGIGEDWGEVVGFGMLGVPVLAALALAWMWSGAPGRAWIGGLVVLLAGLTACGLGADLAASLLGGALLPLILLEDGGEMVFASLLAGQAARPPPRRQPSRR